MMMKMRGIVPLIMWVVIAAFVGLMFFGWGMDLAGGGGGKRQVVGKIDGKDISLQAFDQMVNMERERNRQSASTENGDNQDRFIPQRVWDEQVTNTLLNKTFKGMKLEGSADEIFDYLKSNPPPGIDTASYFKTNGKFDTTKYFAFLNNPTSYDNPGMRQLEEYLFSFVIPGRKLEILLGAGLRPSALEVSREYQEEQERTVVEYAVVSSSKFPVDNNAIADAKLMDYYRANQDTFTSNEPQMDLYFIAKQKLPTAGDEILIVNELNDLKKRLEQNESTFEESAKAESDDQGSVANGGDLGWFGRGAMVPEFDSIVFSIQPGKISDPIRTRYGYHLLKVEETRKGPDGKPQVHALHILKKIVPSLETLDSTKEHLDSIRILAEEVGLDKVAASNGVQMDSTGLFKQGDFIPKIGFVPGLIRFVLDNKEGEIGASVFENRDGFYVVQIKRKLRAGVLPFADAKPAIVQTLEKADAKQKARARLEAAIATLGTTGSLATLSQRDSLVVSGISDTVTRRSGVPALGYDGKALSAAFAVKTGSLSGLVETPGGYCVVRPLWRQSLDSIPKAGPQLTAIQQRIVSQQKQQAYQGWVSALKRSSSVVSNVDKFYTE